MNPWTAAYQASLSITNSQSLLKLMSTELVIPSNHPILCHPLLFIPSTFPSIRSFPVNQFFASGGQSIGALAHSHYSSSTHQPLVNTILLSASLSLSFLVSSCKLYYTVFSLFLPGKLLNFFVLISHKR